MGFMGLMELAALAPAGGSTRSELAQHRWCRGLLPPLVVIEVGDKWHGVRSMPLNIMHKRCR